MGGPARCESGVLSGTSPDRSSAALALQASPDPGVAGPPWGSENTGVLGSTRSPVPTPPWEGSVVISVPSKRGQAWCSDHWDPS